MFNGVPRMRSSIYLLKSFFRRPKRHFGSFMENGIEKRIGFQPRKMKATNTPIIYDFSKMKHDPTFIRWVNNYESIGKRNHHVLFVLGPMGTGKTMVIKTHIMNQQAFKAYIYVDSDEIMASMEGFCMDKINEYYEISRQVSFAVTDWIMLRGYSFIAEGTCVDWLQLWDYMIRLREKEYKISVLFLHETKKLTMWRAANRERFLPPEKVLNIYYLSLEGCQELKRKNEESNIFETVMLIDKKLII